MGRENNYNMLFSKLTLEKEVRKTEFSFKQV